MQKYYLNLIILNFLQFICELWHSLEQIRDQSVIGHLKDRSFRILVDCHNCLRVLHPGQMLNRARDTDRYIQILRKRSFQDL